MADARLRDLERAAARGEPDARAALIAARVRAGSLERERVELAARLGDPAARLYAGVLPLLLVKCQPCFLCSMSGLRPVSTNDLSQIAKFYPFPRRFMSRWALACVRTAAVDLNHENAQLHQLLDDYEAWLDSELTTVNERLGAFITRQNLIRSAQFSTGSDGHADTLIDAGFRLAESVVTTERLFRDKLYAAISAAYHACGTTRVARDKQVALLTFYLLGDLPWD